MSDSKCLALYVCDPMDFPFFSKWKRQRPMPAVPVLVVFVTLAKKREFNP